MTTFNRLTAFTRLWLPPSTFLNHSHSWLSSHVILIYITTSVYTTSLNNRFIDDSVVAGLLFCEHSRSEPCQHRITVSWRFSIFPGIFWDNTWTKFSVSSLSNYHSRKYVHLLIIHTRTHIQHVSCSASVSATHPFHLAICLHSLTFVHSLTHCASRTVGTGSSGGRFPVGAKDVLRNCPYRLWEQPSLLLQR